MITYITSDYLNFIINLIIIVLSSIGTLFYQNFSIVDKSWSILPPLYASIHFFSILYNLNETIFKSLILSNINSFLIILKPIIMIMLVLLWGIRLTLNFYSRGGYQLSHEDYRWKIILNWSQDYLKKFPILFKLRYVFYILFCLSFVAIFQVILLWSLVTPIRELDICLSKISINDIENGIKLNCFGIEYTNVEDILKFNFKDGLATLLFLIHFLIETKADTQMNQFQKSKAKFKEQLELKQKNNNKEGIQEIICLDGDLKRGFITSGLFNYCRHPNFLSEQLMWWSYALFSLKLNLTNLNLLTNIQLILELIQIFLPPLLLSLLFLGSTWLTEKISLLKYPTYKIYCDHVGLWWSFKKVDMDKVELEVKLKNK